MHHYTCLTPSRQVYTASFLQAKLALPADMHGLSRHDRHMSQLLTPTSPPTVDSYLSVLPPTPPPLAATLYNPSAASLSTLACVVSAHVS